MTPIRMVFPIRRAFTCNVCPPTTLEKSAISCSSQPDMICLNMSTHKKKINKISIRRAIKGANDEAAVRALLNDEERGLLVRGWAPQVAILSQPAVGGFLTHCDWNAALEDVTHGLQTLTWPCFTDQFCNEKLLVDELGVGVRSGAKVPAMYLPEEAEGVQVTRSDVERAITELMEGAAERRSRAREIAAEARAAMEEGGSSYSDLPYMICHISELSRKRSHEGEAARAQPPMVLHCRYSPKL
ncbi:UDP-glycosyltransferase 73C5-like [Triticum dicoccoides]|uniref:UDP-glycosyltransferase 73C5-like n=1 Tax=Triticum dicoccoides TaxID=85692 RepID=UPI0018914A08|nr:UDP-glycosyltransferase 73C5-like [Triticum dicoccoides]